MEYTVLPFNWNEFEAPQPHVHINFSWFLLSYSRQKRKLRAATAASYGGELDIIHCQCVRKLVFCYCCRSFVGLFVCSFVRLFVCSFVPLFLCSFVPLFLCSFVRLFVCSFVRLFVCAFVRFFVSPFPPSGSQVLSSVRFSFSQQWNSNITPNNKHAHLWRVCVFLIYWLSLEWHLRDDFNQFQHTVFGHSGEQLTFLTWSEGSSSRVVLTNHCTLGKVRDRMKDFPTLHSVNFDSYLYLLSVNFTYLHAIPQGVFKPESLLGLLYQTSYCKYQMKS